METKNQYEYLLEYTEENAADLTFAVDKVVELVLQNHIDNKGKKDFFSVMKKIIQREDYTTYRCINLLRDIMTDEMYDFLLEELKKEIYKSESISIEIMKIITIDDFSKCYDFLKSIKDNEAISLDLRKFINVVLDFHNGKIKTYGFPRLNQVNQYSTDIKIDWSNIV